MGEAKRRRESDPNFGRIPRNETKRGVVINPGYRSLGPNGFSVDTSVLPRLLRQCLLYWDRIEWPDNNLVSIGGGSDIDYLISAGVLQRTRIVYQGAFGGDLTPVFAQGQLRAFEHLESKEPGVWSLAQANDELFFDGLDIPKMRSLEIQFYDALPYLPEIVSFEDILEFKLKYNAELLGLRAYMDEAYSSVIESSDLARSRMVAFDRIAAAMSDIERALGGSKLPVFKASFSIDIKLDALATKVGFGAGIAKSLGMPIELGAGLGALISMLKLQIVSTPTPKDVRAGPFAYLYRAGRELR